MSPTEATGHQIGEAGIKAGNDRPVDYNFIIFFKFFLKKRSSAYEANDFSCLLYYETNMKKIIIFWNY
ncbi:MAG: hypothetical protein ACW964_01865 [Candidatus Hodarchaeales archaeon]